MIDILFKCVLILGFGFLTYKIGFYTGIDFGIKHSDLIQDFMVQAVEKEHRTK